MLTPYRLPILPPLSPGVPVRQFISLTCNSYLYLETDQCLVSVTFCLIKNVLLWLIDCFQSQCFLFKWKVFVWLIVHFFYVPLENISLIWRRLTLTSLKEKIELTYSRRVLWFDRYSACSIIPIWLALACFYQASSINRSSLLLADYFPFFTNLPFFEDLCLFSLHIVHVRMKLTFYEEWLYYWYCFDYYLNKIEKV
jgi:hypothetical protein